jgi:hypothetical protein
MARHMRHMRGENRVIVWRVDSTVLRDFFCRMPKAERQEVQTDHEQVVDSKLDTGQCAGRGQVCHELNPARALE